MKVVVTAQRRPETLQNSALIVDVRSSEALAKAGVSNVEDLTRLQSGLLIAMATPIAQVYILGVGDFDATALSNSAIAFNIDGVYVSRMQSLSTEFYDLPRVEVLKGPQGTLRPQCQWRGHQSAVQRTHSRPAQRRCVGNLSARTVDATVNLPVGDTLAFRIAGHYARRDGYSSADRGDIDSTGGRVRMLWQPSDAASLLVSANYRHIQGRRPASVMVNGPSNLDTYTNNTQSSGHRLFQFANFAAAASRGHR